MTSKPTKPRKLGDVVIWSSQASGTSSLKQGTIVAVVLPEISPNRIVREVVKRYGASDAAFGWGTARNHISYVVLVERGPTRKPKLYWPRASQLNLVGTNKKLLKD